MSFSYDSSALALPLNHLRLMVQDTDPADFFLQDEEITFIASKEKNVHRAAAKLCRMIGIKINQMPTVIDEALKFDAQNRAREMRLMADEYEKEAVRSESALEDDAVGDDAGSFSLMADCSEPAFTRKLHYS